jgi:hypothetical protein
MAGSSWPLDRWMERGCDWCGPSISSVFLPRCVNQVVETVWGTPQVCSVVIGKIPTVRLEFLLLPEADLPELREQIPGVVTVELVPLQTFTNFMANVGLNLVKLRIAGEAQMSIAAPVATGR